MEEMKFNNGGYQVIKTSGNITILPENETEEKLLDEIENTLNNKIKRLKKDYKEVISTDVEVRNKITIKFACEEFIEFKKDTGLSDKQYLKYNQAMDYLITFFGANKAVKDISVKDASDFRSFLLKVPKNYKKQPTIKDKNIKLLIEKKSKLLDDLERQSISTIEEVMKKIKAMFNDFEAKGYIIKNPFNSLTKIAKNNTNNKTNWKEFKEKDLINILKTSLINDYQEGYNFIKFSLYTGLRRGEVCNLKVRDIDFEKSIIEVDGTKTNNAHRIMVIHKDIEELLRKQVSNKNDNDFVFFNVDVLPNGNLLNEKYRDERIGAFLNNDIIGAVIDEDMKKHYNIHSLRKNFTQIIYLSNEFGDLELKTLLGHSTKSDITDKHYLFGKRDYKQLKEKMDRVDFSEFLPKKILDKEDETILNF